MSVKGEQEFSTTIDAPVDVCFEVITSFERYPQWFSGINSATVVERYDNGLGKIVEFGMDMMFKRIRYVLEYTYKPPTRLDWHSVDGDIESIVGHYDLDPISKAKTQATCRQAISVGFWVPGSLKRMLEQTALRQSVLEFKAAAEAVFAAKPSRKTKRA
ncbi:MAG: SRPBCC family protein [Candidatus Binatia bacterium]|nr:SRPBCC family protein [Candidatus Binatia bacterium]